MSHESDQALYESLSQAEIIQQVKALMKVLEKKEKASSKVLVKVEEKKEAAAPPKGVRPVQLDKNAKWVEYVHQNMLNEGWSSFIHAERSGKGMADVEYPESELIPILDANGVATLNEEGKISYQNVFAGSATESKPNGIQPNLSHAMTMSKIYRVSQPDLYAEFESEYEPPAPAEGAASVAKSSAVAKPRVAMTLEEKMAAAVEKERLKHEEKEQKRLEREAVKAAAAKAKADLKLAAAAAKEALKASKVPKGAVKAVARAPVPVTVPRPKLSPAASPAAAAPAAVAAKPVAASVTPRLKPLAAKPVWTPPAEGQLKRVKVNEIMYYADHLNRVFAPDENDLPGDCVGVYLPATHTISDEDVEEDE